jgi:hypothetical protein
MTYFLCAIISVAVFACSESGRRRDNGSGLAGSLPLAKLALGFISFFLVIYWTLVIGLQYNVGTDYFSYREIFSSIGAAKFYANRERLFYLISSLIIKYNLNPQSGFILFAFIQNACFFLFLGKMRLQYNYRFIFLYFFVSTMFYNQTNTVRQFTSVYLCLIAVFYLYERKLIPFALLVSVSSMLHLSAILLFPVYFYYNGIIGIKKKMIILMFFVSIVLSFIEIGDFFGRLAAYYFSYYSEYSQPSIPLINKLTKYIYIPFYLFSLKYANFLKTRKEIFFYKLGMIAFFIKIALLSSQIALRFVFYFEVFMIFPLYYSLNYFSCDKKICKRNRIFMLFVFVSVCVIMLCSKVIIFAKGEFAYKSILTKNLFR